MQRSPVPLQRPAPGDTQIPIILSDQISPRAVIDIGSNSIRLVVFDIANGYPHPIYNERVFCALGAGVGATGTLPDEALEAGVTAITRFVEVARASGVRDIWPFATSAVRDAANGTDFVKAVRTRTGCEVDVIDGTEEAQLSAEAVLHGVHMHDGVVADLGGGSLELAAIRKGRVQEIDSLPIGTIRLMAKTKDDGAAMKTEIDRQLDTIDWLKNMRGHTLIPIGGALRAFARLHIAQSTYPLEIIHGYTLPSATVSSTAAVLSRLSIRSAEQIQEVSSQRRRTLPLAGVILHSLVERCAPKTVTFSASGVREGYVYSRMKESEAAADPLLAGAKGLAQRDGRFGDTSETLIDWLTPLLQAKKPARMRLQKAVCTLSDIAWREHPDFRDAFAFDRAMHYPFLGLTHTDRAFIGLALFIRYGGKPTHKRVQHYSRLLSHRAIRRAEILGHALRLAYRLSGGSPALLARTKLVIENDTLSVVLPAGGAAPDASRIKRAFERLCAARRLKQGELRIDNS